VRDCQASKAASDKYKESHGRAHLADDQQGKGKRVDKTHDKTHDTAWIVRVRMTVELPDAAALALSTYSRDRDLCADSGATRHVISNKTLFNDLHLYSADDNAPVLATAGKEDIRAQGVGTAVVHARTIHHGILEIHLKDALFIPECDTNLLSLTQVTGTDKPTGRKYTQGPDGASITLKSGAVIPLDARNNLVWLKAVSQPDVATEVSQPGVATESIQVVGHPGRDIPPQRLSSAQRRHRQGLPRLSPRSRPCHATLRRRRRSRRTSPQSRPCQHPPPRPPACGPSLTLMPPTFHPQ
jgi:hypothetical protein